MRGDDPRRAGGAVDDVGGDDDLDVLAIPIGRRLRGDQVHVARLGEELALAGTVSGTTGNRRAPGGAPPQAVEIADGAIEGDRVTFTAWRFDGYHNMTRYAVTRVGDAITFTIERDAAEGPVSVPVAVHVNGTPFDQDRWELFDIAHDPAEAIDLAAKYPDRLKSLQALWWEEAKAYGVLPLSEPRGYGDTRR
jgi:hypothetical protein